MGFGLSLYTLSKPRMQTTILVIFLIKWVDKKNLVSICCNPIVLLGPPFLPFEFTSAAVGTNSRTPGFICFKHTIAGSY